MLNNIVNKLFGRSSSEIQPIQQTQSVQPKRALQPRQIKQQTQKLQVRATSEDLPVFDVNDFQFDSGSYQTDKSGNVKSKVSTAELTDTINELNSLSIGSHIFQSSDINPYAVSEETLKLLTGKFATEHSILPVGNSDDTITFYYSADSLKQKGQIVLNKQFNGKTLKWVQFDEESLRTLIHDYYFGKNSSLFQQEITKVGQEKFSQLRQNEAFISKQQAVISFDSASKVAKEQNYIVEIISNFVCHAYHLGATDINISNRSKLGQNGELIFTLVVRVRVDGRMQTIVSEENIDPSIANAICQVLKILSGRDFVNHKSKDSGKIDARVTCGKKVEPIQIRCQFMYRGVNGQAASMRIQNLHVFNFTTKNIGLSRFQISKFERYMIHGKEGVSILGGKVNRGKTNTLVCIEKAMASFYPDKEIYSVERPIEVSIKEINQIELEENEDFSSIENTFLRSTPDVVVIGETRDSKTAEMVIRVADSGALTITTVHGKNSSEIPKRLKNLGIPLFDIAQSLNCICHQTLVRKICTQCVRVADRDPRIKQVAPYLAHVERLGFINKGFTKASGLMPDGTKCSKCNGSGYSGRTGVFEILVVSEKIRTMIEKNKSPLKIRRQAILEGLHTQFATGLGKVIEGETTLDELLFMVELPSAESEGLDLAIDYPDYQERGESELDELTQLTDIEELNSLSN